MNSSVNAALSQLRRLLEGTPPAGTKCAGSVEDGATVIKGLARYRPCGKPAVFTAENGAHYCATHGKAQGYVAPEKAAKKEWVVFYTLPSGMKTFSYVTAVNEKGAKASFKRLEPNAVVDGLEPYTGNAAMRTEPQFDKWAAWLKAGGIR